MPRKFIELIHYDKFDPKREWSFYCFRSYFKRIGIKGVSAPKFSKLVSALRPYSSGKNLLRPNLLRRMALEFKRSADIKAFNSQFPERSKRNSDEIDYLAVRQVLGREESSSKNRQELAKTINLNSKKKEKYA